MQPAGKDQLRADLQTGRATLIATLAGVSEDLAARTPGPGRWSILQCVEHLAIVEDNLFSRILTSQPCAESPLDPRRETIFRTRALDRTKPIPAPEAALPRGRFTTLFAALFHFIEGRDRTILFLDHCTTDLRRELTTHPILGQVNSYELLLLMAAHPLRHIHQIEEIKAALN
jgi:DinB superfamily